MAASAADVINLDLEDSVAPSDKDTARKLAIRNAAKTKRIWRSFKAGFVRIWPTRACPVCGLR
mgnify:CR=1 FL=1